ncbi:hypothetical protein [Pseudoalteromonas mariniglutinosa]|uniref:hypothetical protein n=1 Tax=Pseudoalteromonas mariniglutinosa TaxID=206042 RepID=UPI00384FE277
MLCASTYKLLVASLASMMMLSGCMSTATYKQTNNADLDELNDQLKQSVSNIGCTASFQCKVLEVGERACGGPSRYLVYSTLHTQQQQAEQLAKQVTNLEQRTEQPINRNDCSPVLPIQALCIAQKCQEFAIK